MMMRGLCRAGARAVAARGVNTFVQRPSFSPVQTPMRSQRWCSFSEADKKEIVDEMKKDIKGQLVVLFMKGEPDAPRCGFSAKAVEVLKQYGVAYTAYNVLSTDIVREGIKEISGWPTIPQLFIAGEFVGGCDLMLEMHQSGDLVDLFQGADVQFVNPKTGITFTPTQGTDDGEAKKE